MVVQQQIASDVIAQGWWDEAGSLPPTEMGALVERWGDRMAFVYTDREFAVEGEPSLELLFLHRTNRTEGFAACAAPGLDRHHRAHRRRSVRR